MTDCDDDVDARPIWAINGRYMTQRMTGVQRYAHEIVASLEKILSEDGDIAKRLGFRLILPGEVEVKPALSQIDVCRTRFGSGHAWDQFVLPWYARSGVLSLGNFGPIAARNHIVCIHDANTFIEPESYSRRFGLAYRTLLPLIGRRASRVATVSQFSADMLIKYGVCRREKIFIAPNGHEQALRWDASRAEIPLLKVLKRPYVLLLGSSAKHKNVDVILKQAQGLDAAGIDIVIVGAASSIFSATAPGHHRSNIYYAGYVGDDDLAALYEAALCLAFPSKTEGFGIPPWEAMRSLMWIPITAMAGATRSLAWQETRIFARRWRRGDERERRCFPGNAARGFTSMKSCACALSRGLSYLLKISHATEAHIERLTASARIHGQGDEPRRPSSVLSPACRIA